MRVNVGSGGTTIPGWINVDIDPSYGTEVVASALDLPFKDGTVDKIYFGHTLEHLDYDTDAVTALREAHRVLKYGGELGVVGPAMDFARAEQVPEWLLRDIEKHGDPPGGHAWTATSENTLALVQQIFHSAYIVPVDMVMRWRDWPNDVPYAWQVAILSITGGLSVADKEAGRARALQWERDRRR